jgi:hypothetical protein
MIVAYHPLFDITAYCFRQSHFVDVDPKMWMKPHGKALALLGTLIMSTLTQTMVYLNLPSTKQSS